MTSVHADFPFIFAVAEETDGGSLQTVVPFLSWNFSTYGDSSSTSELWNFLLVPNMQPFTGLSSLVSSPEISFLTSGFLSTSTDSTAATVAMPFSSLNPAGSEGRLVEGN